MLYESLKSQPRVAHLNDLLRQQSENAYLMMKNWWILHFFAVFLDFQIFQIFDDFETTSLSNSTPWLDFLPGAAFKSPGHTILSLFKFSCSFYAFLRQLSTRIGRHMNTIWTEQSEYDENSSLDWFRSSPGQKIKPRSRIWQWGRLKIIENLKNLKIEKNTAKLKEIMNFWCSKYIFALLTQQIIKMRDPGLRKRLEWLVELIRFSSEE